MLQRLACLARSVGWLVDWSASLSASPLLDMLLIITVFDTKGVEGHFVAGPSSSPAASESCSRPVCWQLAARSERQLRPAAWPHGLRVFQPGSPQKNGRLLRETHQHITTEIVEALLMTSDLQPSVNSRLSSWQPCGTSRLSFDATD